MQPGRNRLRIQRPGKNGAMDRNYRDAQLFGMLLGEQLRGAVERGQAPGRGKSERIVLSPPGVDIDRFDWEDPPTGGPPRILYVGSIDPGRGVAPV